MRGDAIYEIDLLPIDRVARRCISKGVNGYPLKRPRQPVFTDGDGNVNGFRGPREHDLTGTKIGRLEVFGYISFIRPRPGRPRNRVCRWLVRCSCGVIEHRTSRAIKRAHPDGAMCQYCKHLENIKSGWVGRL